MTREKKTRKLQRWQKISLAAVLAVLAYTLIGFFLLPPLIRHLAQKQLRQHLHRATVIREVKFNPFLLTCTVDGLEISRREGKGRSLGCDHLFINLQAASLFRLALIVKQLQVENPYLRIVHHPDGSYNFSDLLPAAPPEEEKKRQKSPLFALHNIEISGGMIEFVDQPRGLTHKITAINIGLPRISNLPSHIKLYVQPSFAAVVNGTPVELHGETKPFADTLETSFKIRITDLDLPYYLSYLPGKRNFTVVAGKLNSELVLAYARPGKQSPYFRLSGYLELTDLRLEGTKNAKYLRIPRLRTEIAPENLLARTLRLKSLVIEKPHFTVVRRPDGTLEFPRLQMLATSTGEEKKAFVTAIDQIRLVAGEFVFHDRQVQPAFTANLVPVNLEINDFSTAKDHLAELKGTLASKAGEELTLKGRFAVTPLTINAHFAGRNFPLRHYLPYYQKFFHGRLTSGRLAAAADLTWKPAGDKPILHLARSTVTLEEVEMKPAAGGEQPLFRIPFFQLDDTDIDLKERRAIIGSLEGKDTLFNLVRAADGRLNLLQLLPERPAAPPAATKPTPTAASPWHLELRQARLRNCRVIFTDAAPGARMEMQLADLHLAGLSNAAGTRGKVDLLLQVNGSGRLQAQGQLGLAPLAARLNCRLQRLALKPFQPYVREFARLEINRGAANGQGLLILERKEGQPFKISFAGRAGITDLNLQDSRDRRKFLSWKQLALTGIRAGSQPPVLEIKKVFLDTVATRLAISPTGQLNLKTILETTGKTPPAGKRSAPGPGGPALAVQVGEIEIKNSRLDFLDFSVKPSFFTTITELNGKIAQLSSTHEQPARLTLTAKANGHAPIAIDGQIHPFADDLFADLKVKMSDVNLSRLTPYSDKYVGYQISKGKLNLQLRYLIDRGRLTASNRIFLDQFTFGNRVESPDATSLPVKLAVALLRNRQGEIDLDLPVAGDLNDPQFSLGNVIVKVVVNLITKAVTSPFSLLGAAFGGGPDVNIITFPPGRATFDGENRKKLDTMAKILYERPALKLEVHGYVDPVSDRQGLEELFFQRQLKVQKLKELGQAATGDDPDTLTIGEKEYEHYLKKAYKAAKFAKPKNFIGLTKSLPAATMEKLLREHIEITGDDLRRLAYQRAEKVKNYLISKGPVEAGRIFLVEPETGGAGGGPETAANRKVEMVLR